MIQYVQLVSLELTLFCWEPNKFVILSNQYSTTDWLLASVWQCTWSRMIILMAHDVLNRIWDTMVFLPKFFFSTLEQYSSSALGSA